MILQVCFLYCMIIIRGVWLSATALLVILEVDIFRWDIFKGSIVPTTTSFQLIGSHLAEKTSLNQSIPLTRTLLLTSRFLRNLGLKSTRLLFPVSYFCLSEGPGDWLAVQLDFWSVKPSEEGLSIDRRVRIYYNNFFAFTNAIL